MGKDLRKEKGEADRGGKGLRGERGKRISAGKGGGKDLREEREKIWGQRP